MKTFKTLWLLVIVLALLISGTGVVWAQGEEPDEEPDGEGQNPVALFLANVIGIPYEEVIALQEAGYGMGQISKAYYYNSLTGGTDLAAVMAQAHEIGWGQLFRQAGYHPGGGHGLGWMFKTYPEGDKPGKGHGKPEWAGGQHKNK